MAKADLPLLRIPEHLKMLRGFINGLRKGVYRVNIERVREQRSLGQNAYMWAVVLPIAAAGLSEAWGYRVDADEAHEFFKDRFLRKPFINRHTGEVTGYTNGSSADLDSAEFAEYLEQIISFCASELGAVVPPPGDYDTTNGKGAEHANR